MLQTLESTRGLLDNQTSLGQPSPLAEIYPDRELIFLFERDTLRPSPRAVVRSQLSRYW